LALFQWHGKIIKARRTRLSVRSNSIKRHILKNFILAIAAFFGASGVAMGAFGAHALKAKMQAGLMTADQLNGFDTAAKYQLFHAILVVAVFFAAKDKQLKWLNAGAWFFITGILLFSGSLYLLTTRSLTGMESLTFLGPVTPFGGLALMGGWICLMVQAFKWGKTAKG
jgi:uncharacterized membrane protein YgdD (TMEM256/DUF423 family)